MALVATVPLDEYLCRSKRSPVGVGNVVAGGIEYGMHLVSLVQKVLRGHQRPHPRSHHGSGLSRGHFHHVQGRGAGDFGHGRLHHQAGLFDQVLRGSVVGQRHHVSQIDRLDMVGVDSLVANGGNQVLAVSGVLVRVGRVSAENDALELVFIDLPEDFFEVVDIVEIFDDFHMMPLAGHLFRRCRQVHVFVQQPPAIRYEQSDFHVAPKTSLSDVNQ